MVSSMAGAMCAVFTPLVRSAARRLGAVAEPKRDRWHKEPTALFGGVAIWLAVIVTLVVLVPESRDRWTVIAVSSALFVLGVVDDLVHFKPYQKVIGQFLGAASLVSLGLVLPWTSSSLLNLIVTIVWLIGITNAVNMLDNMDGLAAGVGAIAAVSLALQFFVNGQLNESLMLVGFAGALLSFLVYNRNPASIFMGDSGSMFIGFFLASVTLLASYGGGGRIRSIAAVLAVPVLVLAVPIFDTTFVTLVRKAAGRAASQGGRDHTSHRLVALGISERSAVGILYAFAILGGAIAALLRRAPVDLSLAAIAVFVIVLTFIGVHLGHVRVYDDPAAIRETTFASFLVNLSYKRRLFEVVLDVILITLSYYLAHVLRLGPMSAAREWRVFLQTLPVIVFVQIGVFLATGIYGGIWRYVSLGDVYVYARGVVVAMLGTVAVVAVWSPAMMIGRSVVIVDAVILMIAVTASRFAFRLLRRLSAVRQSQHGRRALIFGAGDAGELLCRELNNNPGLNYLGVGFIDDDRRKAGKQIHDLPVFDGSSAIGDLCREKKVGAVILSTHKVPLHRLRMILASCAEADVVVERMEIVLRPLLIETIERATTIDGIRSLKPVPQQE